MKRSITTRRSIHSNKLSLRAETIRILTERELVLAVAGNCVYASGPALTTRPSSPDPYGEDSIRESTSE